MSIANRNKMSREFSMLFNEFSETFYPQIKSYLSFF